MAALGRLFVWTVLFALLSNYSFAATIHGNIYDLSLIKAAGAKVTVNSTPEQFMIAEQGSYSFEVPKGFYAITAEKSDGAKASESRNVSITQDGRYVIDLILFPSFEEEEDISEDIGISIPEAEETRVVPLFGMLFIVAIIIVLFVIFRGKKENERETENREENADENYLEKIIDVIKKEGGRATQKDIRKQIPFSEAKISLMISELEHKGKVEKIKKGRGNLIILKK